VNNTLRAALTAAVLTASMACSSNSSAPSDLSSSTSNRASFNITVRPSPVKATRCSPQCPGQTSSASFAFSADMTVDVQNTTAVGATINSMTLTATAEGTTFAPINFSSDDLKGQTGGANHLDGRATLSIPLTIVYNTPSGTANLSVSLNLQITDDRGNQVTATGQVSVL
jgi:hypothetical protein